jgi:hypothetical protein
MKKNFLILIFALSSVIMLDSCGSSSSSEKKSTTKEVAAAEYTCPMHSEVQSKEAGKCPKCGMDLVEKKKQDID